ncbi:uncharacterized protein LOC124361914 [Homalodisca vitripennis]|uniref:uncharacterized protein LOC124361914 n=1 Tax=Homalodisca vitripennis TaxID=197043 RepID=UPI001EEB3352|nr:uncharacterized protein LOC124361914 [Homalodisca vitripennis]
MKSMTALTVLLISIWSQSQVSADESTKLKLKPYDPLLEQEPNGLEQQLAKLVYVLDSFKDEWSRSNHEEILKSVMKIKPTISNLIKRNLKNCDIDALEHVVEDLVNTTVGFLTNVSGSVEAICNQVYQCANDGFPKSLGCFLELPQSCESYIQDIQEQLNEFLPKANKLALKIATEIVNCLP